MIMKKNTSQSGFTLIEILIAILLLGVGILGVGVMQNTSIQGNSTANNLTGAANWSGDALETFMARPFTHNDLIDDNADGIAGINNTDVVGSLADGGPVVQGIFTVFWNVVDNYPVLGTKTIRVIVQRPERGQVKIINMDFTKMEPI